MKKLALWKSSLLFGIPSVYFFALTKYAVPYLTRTKGMHPALGWFVTGYFVFVPLFILAILLVKREDRTVTFIGLLKRLRLKKLSTKDMYWTLGSTSLILMLTGVIMLVSKVLSAAYGMHELQTTPSFMHFNVLEGSERLYLFIWLPMFFFNIIGEEMLWHGYILPRQELEHGNLAWLVNALLWILFHLCFGLDLLIVLLPTLFIIPYTIQRTKNTLTGVISHAMLNGPMFVLVALGLIQ